MPIVPFIPAIIGAGTAIGTSVYQHKQQNKVADAQLDRELSARKIQQEAAERAFQFGKEDQDYTRWLTAAQGDARQPYLNLLAGQGGGGMYDPGSYGAPEPFVAPTREAAMNDPSYQMVVDEGNRVAESSGAARSGLDAKTLGALHAYGREAATTQYDKVYDRARNAYAMKEALRGQAWDRTTGPGFQAAGLRTQNFGARTGGLLSIAQLAGAGHYPGYVDPTTGPLAGPLWRG